MPGPEVALGVGFGEHSFWQTACQNITEMGSLVFWDEKKAAFRHRLVISVLGFIAIFVIVLVLN